ncbi:hypothetical protein [uncultured Tateyamaria sp.]|uniref:hypothetical protein n=1 Tax=Tateyamaria sp. 1078 TaxID=3417464 RepID=UPI00261AA6CF|nr:hypothetical protein [uncultured Tateyamaria sp.]
MTAWRAALVLVLALAFGASPLWVPDFGGFDPDSFPIPQNDPPVQPKGYAFAIWGLIYLWLIAGSAFGLLKRGTDPAWDAMRLPLALSLAVGAIWLPVAVLSPVWATILIWAMLLPALVALFRAPQDDIWTAAWPVGLYAGWLSAASCVAIGLLLGGYGFLSEDMAALVMIGIAALLAFGVQTRLGRTPTYGIAAIWALIAILVQNGVAASAGLAAAAAAIVLISPTLRAARGH